MIEASLTCNIYLYHHAYVQYPNGVVACWWYDEVQAVWVLNITITFSLFI